MLYRNIYRVILFHLSNTFWKFVDYSLRLDPGWYLIRNGGVVDTQIGDTRRLFHLYISYYAYRTTRLRLLGNAESPPVLLSPRSPDLVTLSKASADLSRSCLRDPR